MLIYEIDPLQPYFVLNTQIYYKINPVNSPIAHFYQFTCTEDNPIVNGVVPDGATDFIFDISNGEAVVSGSVESVIRTPFKRGNTYFGVRLKPGTTEHYGDISVSELLGKSVPLADVTKMSRFEQAFDCKSFENRANIVNNIVLDMIGDSEKKDTPELVNEILLNIYDRKGDISVNELEKTLFYSRRHLLRMFRQYTGMDIKSFCRITRFQSVLSQLSHGKYSGFSDVAQQYGYYDQTHFQKEFKEYSLLTPKIYVNTLDDIKYQNRIKHF